MCEREWCMPSIYLLVGIYIAACVVIGWVCGLVASWIARRSKPKPVWDYGPGGEAFSTRRIDHATGRVQEWIDVDQTGWCGAYWRDVK